jgi:hypothetical protein
MIGFSYLKNFLGKIHSNNKLIALKIYSQKQ